ncbi:hypothetical protein ACWDF9_06925 [Streptomyces rubiginosohelvolus]
MNTDGEKGQQMTPTPGGPLTSPEEASEGYELVRTPVDYDPEDVQLSALTDDGDVVMYLPEITYLDTQPWSVEIGLTPERLVQLRDALNNHLRGAADHAGPANRVDTDTVARSREDLANGSRSDIATTAVDNLSAATAGRGDTPTTGPDGGTACPPAVDERPTTVVQRTTVAPSSKGAANDSGPSGTSVVAVTATVPLRERLRAALRRHIDPDDDTMPALDHAGFVWVDTDEVLDDLIKAMQPPPVKYPITTHAYEGDRFLHPCTARGYGSMCGATEYDHMEPE